MGLKTFLRVLLVAVVSFGITSRATAQKDHARLHVSYDPTRTFYAVLLAMNELGIICLGIYAALFLMPGCQQVDAAEQRPASFKPNAREVYAQVVSGAGKLKSLELLNVSYDPTRELWRHLNAMFISEYLKEANTQLEIKQSHGGSSTQARAVIDGLEADVVTLALWSDTDAIRKKGLIAENWEQRLPNRSLPYLSTIIFVVRKGNPKGVKDWPDLVQPGIAIVTANPKTSGNGQLSFYSAWGSVVVRGGSREDAIAYVTKLYQQVPVLDSGARGATTTFVQKGIGDVHLAWENEAHLEAQEAHGALELVYPPISMRAEPHVAVVDANVDRKGTRAAAEAYLQFLYTDEAQEIVAKHYYRPTNEEILKKHRETFPEMRLFAVTDIGENWDDVHKKLVGDGSVFDTIYKPKRH